MRFYLRKVILEISKTAFHHMREDLGIWRGRLAEQGIEAHLVELGGHWGQESSDLEDPLSDGINRAASEIGTLWITDDSMCAKGHLRRKEPVLGWLHAAYEESEGSGNDSVGDAGNGKEDVRIADIGIEGISDTVTGNFVGDFDGVGYLVMDLQEVDADYLDKVYRRYLDIPWDILETERCCLRETTLEDVAAFYEIYAEPSVTRFMEDLFADREAELAYTQDYKEKVYEFYGYGIWTVCLKETGEVIGRAGLNPREGYEQPELGFVIGVPWQHKGLATEVCKAVLSFGRRELGMTEVIAFVQPENLASEHILQKLGFEREGRTVILGRDHGIWRNHELPF